MSKGSKGRTRGNYSTSNRRLRFVSFRIYKPTKSKLTQYEDRRLWHPESDYAPAVSFSQPRHRLVAPKVRRQHVIGSAGRSLHHMLPKIPAVVAFASPKRVLICVRRGIRKEVLHALNKTGISGQRRPRRTAYSQISCRG